MKKVVQDLTSGGLLGVWGKWMKHAKYIYNIQDFNPEQVLAVGYTKSKLITDANMMYVMRKQLTPDQIEEVFRKLNLIFEFADFSPAVLERAVNMKWKDFEDAVQSATAESIHADYIITRNLKDLPDSAPADRTVGSECADRGGIQKKPRKSEREMTTPLFLLRCVQLGISIADLDLLTIGLVNDMFTERQNDGYSYKELASQSDFDRF